MKGFCERGQCHWNGIGGERFSRRWEWERKSNCSLHLGPHGQPARHRQGHRMPSQPFISSLLLFPSLHVVCPFSQTPTWHQSFSSTLAPTLLLFQTRMWSSPLSSLPLLPSIFCILTSPHLISLSPANYNYSLFYLSSKYYYYYCIILFVKIIINYFNYVTTLLFIGEYY